MRTFSLLLFELVVVVVAFPHLGVLAFCAFGKRGFVHLLLWLKQNVFQCHIRYLVMIVADGNRESVW